MGLCLWPWPSCLPGPPHSPVPPPLSPTLSPSQLKAQAPASLVHTPHPRQPLPPSSRALCGGSAQHAPVCGHIPRDSPTLANSVVCPSPLSHPLLHSAAGGWGKGVGAGARNLCEICGSHSTEEASLWFPRCALQRVPLPGRWRCPGLWPAHM